MTKTVAVTIEVEVMVDETKFTEEWMTEFRKTMYNFRTINDHMKHIAQLQAREIINLENHPKEFIEGYGHANEMGISAMIVGQDEEVQ